MSDSPSPSGLLLSRDLIFTTKVVGTARALGLAMTVVGNPVAVESALRAGNVRAVFVDLSAGDLVAPDAIHSYRALAPSVPFLAFGSHVDVDSLASAASAGCDPVMPRSRFSSELPALLTHYLGASS